MFAPTTREYDVKTTIGKPPCNGVKTVELNYSHPLKRVRTANSYSIKSGHVRPITGLAAGSSHCSGRAAGRDQSNNNSHGSAFGPCVVRCHGRDAGDRPAAGQVVARRREE